LDWLHNVGQLCGNARQFGPVGCGQDGGSERVNGAVETVKVESSGIGEGVFSRPPRLAGG
jgi:hypothetical protein